MTKALATRNPAWFNLGATVADAMTADDALRAAKMNDWNVRKEPMFTSSGIEVPNRVATVRTDSETGETRYLGYVGHNYTIHQNEEMFEFLDGIVDESGAHYDTAGFTKNGARTFVTMKLPDGINVGGEDAHDLYLLARNGHDGFAAFEVAVVPIRLMCTNQITAAFRNAQQRWKIRHTAHMAGRIAEARASLELTWQYADTFTTELGRLLDDAYTEAEFHKLTTGLVPDAKTEGSQKRVERQRLDLMHLFTDAETNAYGRGTRYGAYNAVAEWADWYAPINGRDEDGTRRAARIMDDGSRVQVAKDYALRALLPA